MISSFSEASWILPEEFTSSLNAPIMAFFLPLLYFVLNAFSVRLRSLISSRFRSSLLTLLPIELKLLALSLFETSFLEILKSPIFLLLDLELIEIEDLFSIFLGLE